MTKDERKKLRELAIAATPGPWKADYVVIYAEKYDTVKMIKNDDDTESPHHTGMVALAYGCRPTIGDVAVGAMQDNAALMAAANPTTVLALLDELEKLEQFIEERDWILKRAGAE